MAISDMPIFSMLRTRMEWHQERQRVLAENVANADTPKYQAARPRAAEIRCRRAEASLRSRLRAPARAPRRRRTAATPHSIPTSKSGNYEVRPAGNAVNP